VCLLNGWKHCWSNPPFLKEEIHFYVRRKSLSSPSSSAFLCPEKASLLTLLSVPSRFVCCVSVCVGEEGAGRVLVVQNRGVSALVTALCTHGDVLTIVLPCLQTLAALTQDAVRVGERGRGGKNHDRDRLRGTSCVPQSIAIKRIRD
jgi:hypothetical protein